jgi:hypothetical protein
MPLNCKFRALFVSPTLGWHEHAQSQHELPSASEIDSTSMPAGWGDEIIRILAERQGYTRLYGDQSKLESRALW